MIASYASLTSGGKCTDRNSAALASSQKLYSQPDRRQDSMRRLMFGYFAGVTASNQVWWTMRGTSRSGSRRYRGARTVRTLDTGLSLTDISQSSSQYLGQTSAHSVQSGRNPSGEQLLGRRYKQ